MGQRQDLHNLLQEAAGEENKVYFQPPSGHVMSYPCIVYQRANADVKFADNEQYSLFKRYTVTVIDQNPDSPIPDRVAKLPLCSMSTFFVADKLNHDVFDIFF